MRSCTIHKYVNRVVVNGAYQTKGDGGVKAVDGVEGDLRGWVRRGNVGIKGVIRREGVKVKVRGGPIAFNKHESFFRAFVIWRIVFIAREA